MIAVFNHDSYFVQKKDALCVMCLIPEQKITAALRMLAYGASADQVDEIARMGKSTILESLMSFREQSNLSTPQSTSGDLLRWTCKGF